ncbi:RskA family anti-sigma factor [Nocardia takedensis]|uniref:hypothetical protein n=1 Tax=Nocardia takedensis TaxID=259390 RepID=UPI000305DA50|nr:hypothetical protein [Nocardia takedensis]
MSEARIDLAHAVALGSIDDEDQHAVQDLLDSDDPAFGAEVRRTRAALAALAEATATEPPAELRGRLLAAVAEQPPVAS